MDTTKFKRKKTYWKGKIKKGLQYLVIWTSKNSGVITKFEGDDRSHYLVENDICNCRSFKMKRKCCHIDIFNGHLLGDRLSIESKLQLISYIMNTYAGISNSVDVEIEEDSLVAFKFSSSNLPKSRLIFWWDKSPVMLDFNLDGEQVDNEFGV